jgi:hypothetical protein
MSKTLALTSFIPKISSVTKTEVKAKHATVSVTSMRSVSAVRPAVKRSVRASRTKSFSGNWVAFSSVAGVALAVVAMGFYVFMINASASN